MNMVPEEKRAVLSLCLLAAFANGKKHERERAQIRRVAEGFQESDAVHLSTLYQDVLMKRITLPGVVAQLASTESKRLAYEMAVCVCDADGALSDAEQRFLADASAALGLDAGASAAFKGEALAVALLHVSGPAVADTVAPASKAVNDAELDSAILNAAILNGMRT